MAKEKLDALDKYIASKVCRKFDPRITRQQIMIEPIFVASWGAHDWAGINEDYLVFKVNGRLHKGFVIITLNGMDTYDIHLATKDFDLVGEATTDIYEDQLVYVLDNLIETPEK